MHPLLARADRALRDSAGSLSSDAIARHVGGRWSVADVLEHLGLTFSGTVRGLHRVLEHGVQGLPAPTLEQRVGTLVVVQLGYFPSGRQSPETMKPRGNADPATVLATTLSHLAAMDDALDAAELRFGPRIRVLQHPVLGPFNLHHWRRFHWVHTRHHARQIRERAGR
jgi:hypothetical protein